MLAEMIKPLDQCMKRITAWFSALLPDHGNAADAEDVLQTVFLRMVRGNPDVETRKLSAKVGGERGARRGAGAAR